MLMISFVLGHGFFSYLPYTLPYTFHLFLTFTPTVSFLFLNCLPYSFELSSAGRAIVPFEGKEAYLLTLFTRLSLHTRNFVIRSESGFNMQDKDNR